MMRVTQRLYLTVLPAVVGLLTVAALAYWGQYAHTVPTVFLVIAAVATVASLALTWVNARQISAGEVKDMSDTMLARGPDAGGVVHVDRHAGLGHRRLSIIDLAASVQPMSNEDGTVWIVYNGEVYNFVELRQELLARGHQFRTAGDTEVIVHLYEEYGPDCVTRLRGMFAFAIWDARSDTLLLARDRIGIKPLYYTLNDQAFLFGSELKALVADEHFRSIREINLRRSQLPVVPVCSRPLVYLPRCS